MPYIASYMESVSSGQRYEKNVKPTLVIWKNIGKVYKIRIINYCRGEGARSLNVQLSNNPKAGWGFDAE